MRSLHTRRERSPYSLQPEKAACNNNESMCHTKDQCNRKKNNLNIYIYACMHARSFQSCPTLCDPMDTAHQAPPSTGFSRQEYWSGLPFPSPIYIYVSNVFLTVWATVNRFEKALHSLCPQMKEQCKQRTKLPWDADKPGAISTQAVNELSFRFLIILKA